MQAATRTASAPLAAAVSGTVFATLMKSVPHALLAVMSVVGILLAELSAVPAIRLFLAGVVPLVLMAVVFGPRVAARAGCILMVAIPALALRNVAVASSLAEINTRLELLSHGQRGLILFTSCLGVWLGLLPSTVLSLRLRIVTMALFQTTLLFSELLFAARAGDLCMAVMMMQYAQFPCCASFLTVLAVVHWAQPLFAPPQPSSVV